MKWLFTNNASAIISAPISATSTVIRVEVNAGTIFPDPALDQGFAATLVASDGRFEIVRAVDRSGDNITVLRAQEGTAAGAFDTGSRFELRLTKSVMEGMLQTAGGTMSGDVDFTGHNIRNLRLPGQTFMAHAQVGTLRAIDIPYDTVVGSLLARVMTFPSGGGPVRVGASAIVTGNHLKNLIFTWSGNIDDLEPWFKWCDGTLGTPDLRGRFLIGGFKEAASQFTIGDYGGSFDNDTEGAGAHSHGGTVNETKLNRDQVPQLIKEEKQREDDDGPTMSVTNIAYSTNESPAAHKHTIPTTGNHAHHVTIIQPWFAIAYVKLDVTKM